jgi:hypothetical protein
MRGGGQTLKKNTRLSVLKDGKADPAEDFFDSIDPHETSRAPASASQSSPAIAFAMGY